MPRGIAWRGSKKRSPEKATATCSVAVRSPTDVRGLFGGGGLLRGRRGGFRGLRRLRGGLAGLGRLHAEPLRETLHAAFRVDQLLAPREERVTVITDFEVQFRLGRPGLPRCAARAARLDIVVLGVNPFLHGLLLGVLGKRLV